MYGNNSSMGSGNSGGFSNDFLKYLSEARKTKLQQGQADIGKTFAETQYTQAGAEATKAQAGLTTAKTASEYGLTEPSKAAIGLTKAQTSKTEAETETEKENKKLTAASTYKTLGDTNFQTALKNSSIFGSLSGSGSGTTSTFKWLT